jgi:hypothetical protein
VSEVPALRPFESDVLNTAVDGSVQSCHSNLARRPLPFRSGNHVPPNLPTIQERRKKMREYKNTTAQPEPLIRSMAVGPRSPPPRSWKRKRPFLSEAPKASGISWSSSTGQAKRVRTHDNNIAAEASRQLCAGYWCDNDGGRYGPSVRSPWPRKNHALQKAFGKKHSTRIE